MKSLDLSRFLGILQSDRKSKIVKIVLKIAFLCKFFDEKRSVPNIRTDLLKVFDYWARKYVLYPGISLIEFSLTIAMPYLHSDTNYNNIFNKTLMSIKLIYHSKTLLICVFNKLNHYIIECD